LAILHTVGSVPGEKGKGEAGLEENEPCKDAGI